MIFCCNFNPLADLSLRKSAGGVQHPRLAKRIRKDGSFFTAKEPQLKGGPADFPPFSAGFFILLTAALSRLQRVGGQTRPYQRRGYAPQRANPAAR